MRMDAFICQADALAEHFAGDAAQRYSEDELRLLGLALEQAANVCWHEIGERIKTWEVAAERAGKPRPKVICGLLDGIMPPDLGGAA